MSPADVLFALFVTLTGMGGWGGGGGQRCKYSPGHPSLRLCRVLLEVQASQGDHVDLLRPWGQGGQAGPEKTRYMLLTHRPAYPSKSQVDGRDSSVGWASDGKVRSNADAGLIP